MLRFFTNRFFVGYYQIHMKVDQRPSFDIAKGIPDGGIFVEIGTWEGGFSDVLLGQTGCKKLYCVDPYKHFTAGEYPDGMNQLTQTMFDTKYEKTRQKMEKYGDRVEFIRKESCEAALLFDDHSVDYVYIDGNHDYKYVLADIRAWYPKIRPGGWLCGDDVYSQNLAEHDTDGNVLRIWSPGCWGKYGTYKAIVDSGLHFRIVMTQFIVQKV